MRVEKVEKPHQDSANVGQTERKRPLANVENEWSEDEGEEREDSDEEAGIRVVMNYSRLGSLTDPSCPKSHQARRAPRRPLPSTSTSSSPAASLAFCRQKWAQGRLSPQRLAQLEDLGMARPRSLSPGGTATTTTTASTPTPIAASPPPSQFTSSAPFFPPTSSAYPRVARSRSPPPPSPRPSPAAAPTPPVALQSPLASALRPSVFAAYAAARYGPPPSAASRQALAALPSAPPSLSALLLGTLDYQPYHPPATTNTTTP